MPAAQVLQAVPGWRPMIEQQDWAWYSEFHAVFVGRAEQVLTGVQVAEQRCESRAPVTGPRTRTLNLPGPGSAALGREWVARPHEEEPA
jgi:hypothetical protein